MLFSVLLTISLAILTFAAALPIGVAYSQDLKMAVAQERAQERHLASSTSLLEERRAYQLETAEVATFNYKRKLDAAVSRSSSVPRTQN